MINSIKKYFLTLVMLITSVPVAFAMQHVNLRLGVDENASEAEKLTGELNTAIMQGDVEGVRDLMELQAPVNALPGNLAPLFFAVMLPYQTDEIIQLLLENGANPDASAMPDGRTPLMVVAQSERVNRARLLLEYGSKIDAKGPAGYTALIIAARHGKHEMVELLLTMILPEERQRIIENIPSLKAANLSFLQIRDPKLPRDVRKLLTRAFVETFVDEHMQMVNHLLTQRTDEGKNAFDLAKEHGHTDVAELLDVHDSDAQQKIRKMVRNNVKHILFGEPTEIVPAKISESESDPGYAYPGHRAWPYEAQDRQASPDKEAK